GWTRRVLPGVWSNALPGLRERRPARPCEAKPDLPLLAQQLHMEVDDLFPIAEMLQLLRFAELFEGDIRLTDAGRRFAEAGTDERKALFAKHIVAYVPLAAHIKRVLDERPSHRAPMLRFKDELEDHMGETEADGTLRAVISLARYAELFAYDEPSSTFNLENPA